MPELVCAMELPDPAREGTPREVRSSRSSTSVLLEPSEDLLMKRASNIDKLAVETLARETRCPGLGKPVGGGREGSGQEGGQFVYF